MRLILAQTHETCSVGPSGRNLLQQFFLEGAKCQAKRYVSDHLVRLEFPTLG